MLKYKDLLVLELSGTTEWKSDAEMIIPDDLTDGLMKNGWNYTCEFLGDGNYIIREYEYETQRVEEWYYRDVLHGPFLLWNRHGVKIVEDYFKYNNLHGQSINYLDTTGKKYKIITYKDDELHGKTIIWEDGSRIERTYCNGDLICEEKFDTFFDSYYSSFSEDREVLYG